MNLYTAQYSYHGIDRIDITVKSGNKAFAPKWDMVMGVKNKTISEEEYTRQYRQLMIKSYYEQQEERKKIMDMDDCTIVCFCPYLDKITKEKVFCHRHLLAEYLTKLGATYKGER